MYKRFCQHKWLLKTTYQVLTWKYISKPVDNKSVNVGKRVESASYSSELSRISSCLNEASRSLSSYIKFYRTMGRDSYKTQDLNRSASIDEDVQILVRQLLTFNIRMIFLNMMLQKCMQFSCISGNIPLLPILFAWQACTNK